ncbi:hypothetical protein CUR178_02095 [Leishmania enriettii]|uniref:Uncharacterized protein n=1 Tax=Leishmania enriettii TaxID=5663 RepID=A0A836GU56_LEIEN|nr:hypothetical protein CUR178_02095 [Leishmania enriettii]
MAKKSLKAPHKEPSKKAKAVLGHVDCVPFTFTDAEDARIYYEVEHLLKKLQAEPSAEALVAVQHKLMELERYPTVVAVVSGRFPLLFSELVQFDQDLGVARAEPLRVSGVKWDVWCRNTWLTNACAVEDIGDQALITLATLPQLLRSIDKDDEGTENEVWSALHVLLWALRCSAIGSSVAALLESCEELWLLVESEVAQTGRHVGVKLLLLDLLSALALHVDSSPTLSKRLLALVAKMAQLPLPVHFHTAVKLYYGCAAAEQADEGGAMGKAHEQLLDAWAQMTQQSAAIPLALQLSAYIVGEEGKQTIETATQLHRLLRNSSGGGGDAVVDAETVTAFYKKACELPAAARAFCVHALPGNPLLWLHRALVKSPTAQLVAAVADVLTDVVLDAALVDESAGLSNSRNALSGKSAYAQLCLQQLWASGMSVSLSNLLNARDLAIKAAVVHLLQRLATLTPRDCSARRVLLGSPSISLVIGVLAVIAESDSVKGELKRKAVRAVVEHAFDLVCALNHAELNSVFSDSIVMSVSTIISEGKDIPALLQKGLQALAHLAAAFPMAASMTLDFDFLAEQCTIADPPSVGVGALIVGSLRVMSAIVAMQSDVVTFEWIEILLGVLKSLERWRDEVPGLDAALWQCVRHTVEASEDCGEYLFTEEGLEVFYKELKRMKCEAAHHTDIMPSLFAIAVRLQLSGHALVNAAAQEVIACVPAAQWTWDMCDSALRFLTESCRSLNCNKADEAAAQRIVTAAVAVLYGAEQSYLHQLASARDDFVRSLSGSGLAAHAVTALFDLADAAAATLSAADAAAVPCEVAKLRGAALPLLQRLLATCPTVRLPASAERAQRLCSALAGSTSSACTPQLLEAVLLLVEGTCAGGTPAGPSSDTGEMLQVWSSLTSIAQQAAGKVGEDAWSAVLGRTYAAAHNLFLASSAIPIVGECDPRVDFVGQCGLLHLSKAECTAFLQTVLHCDDVRASLRRAYGELYEAALERIADNDSHASGTVPLPLQRYLGEVKQS